MTDGVRDSWKQLTRHIECSGSTLLRCGNSAQFMQHSDSDGHGEAGSAFGTGEVPRSCAPLLWMGRRPRMLLPGLSCIRETIRFRSTGHPLWTIPSLGSPIPPPGVPLQPEGGFGSSCLQFLFRPSARATRALGSKPNRCSRVVTQQESASGPRESESQPPADPGLRRQKPIGIR